MTPFEIKDCILLVRMSNLLPAVNLRELRDRFLLHARRYVRVRRHGLRLRVLHRRPGVPGGA